MSGRTSHRSGAMGTSDGSDATLGDDEGGDAGQRVPPAAAEGTRLLLSRSSQEQNHFLVK